MWIDPSKMIRRAYDVVVVRVSCDEARNVTVWSRMHGFHLSRMKQGDFGAWNQSKPPTLCFVDQYDIRPNRSSRKNQPFMTNNSFILQEHNPDHDFPETPHFY